MYAIRSYYAGFQDDGEGMAAEKAGPYGEQGEGKGGAARKE